MQKNQSMIASRNHIQRINKLEGIAEILGLIEEKGKNKDWLLDELKHHHVKLAVSPTQTALKYKEKFVTIKRI